MPCRCVTFAWQLSAMGELNYMFVFDPASSCSALLGFCCRAGHTIPTPRAQHLLAMAVEYAASTRAAGAQDLAAVIKQRLS